MATIDIRDDTKYTDAKIRFADPVETECYEITIPAGPYIQMFDGTDEYILVANKNVPNLIKALQKAIDLGWTK